MSIKSINNNYLFLYSFLFTVYLHAEIFEGNTLFTPLIIGGVPTTHLINNDYNILHTWSHDYGPASMPYLLPDSSIIYPFRVPFPTMEAGGVGGGVQKQSWDGEIIWEYIFIFALQ